MCSGASRESCSLLYLYRRTTYFMWCDCSRCIIIFSTTHSFLLTALCLLVTLQGVRTLGFALLCDWISRYEAEGACATRSIHTVRGLPLSSIVIVFLWTTIIQHSPLAPVWSFFAVVVCHSPRQSVGCCLHEWIIQEHLWFWIRGRYIANVTIVAELASRVRL